MPTTEDKKAKAIEKIEKAAKKGFGKGLTEAVIEDAVSKGIQKAKDKAVKNRTRPIKVPHPKKKVPPVDQN
jgi:hypothetical protein